MRLMLNPQLKFRLWPLSSFCGILDLKTAVEIALLFAVLNKVAGVYGLIAVLTGAGGSFAQLSMYIYSVLGLIALGWGLQVVKAEDARQTFYLAHLFCADYVLSTSWTVYFAVRWWWHTPHDGARQANSQAQEDLIAVAQITGPTLTNEQRAEAARLIWNQEKGLAFAVVLISWLSKIYLALLIYSYAIHLRKGSYRSLALTRASPQRPINGAASSALPGALPEDELDEDIEDFYRVPLRTPPPKPKHSNGHPSVSSFADFVGGSDTALNQKPKKTPGDALKAPADADDDDEVLFDTDEYPYTSSGSTSKAHSKRGTETSTSGSRSDEDDSDVFRNPTSTKV
ncbi:Inositolphosphorylceramide synthase subunit Kei1-domain-containing protein [Mycena albidolilacea]|uniref:Inositolphosphorylceramide synthase subunit Kei1-domain-containing protein n=1 Tax=Mycena albidolilacea TaxID=1033008 RepID=A0AAD7AE98_9AGAR|nr:Inositolphosphorylceramide synthase subunit Kei1-domain-containing protein [Mycena albidolilacea]